MAGLRKFESHPKIDMAALVRHGLFDPRLDKPLGFYCGGSGMLVRYSHVTEQIQLYFDTRLEPHQMVVIHQTIDVGFARTKQGPRPYFVCPDSGARCQELHLSEDHFVSRRMHPDLKGDKPSPAHRRAARLEEMRDCLLGLNGHPRAKGPERAEMLAKFVREPFVRLRFPELAPAVDDFIDTVHRVRRRNARASLAQNRDPFIWALLQGRIDRVPFDISAHLARTPQEWIETIPEPRDRFGNSPLSYLEDQISLDVRKLAKFWRLDEQGIWAQRILWVGLKAVLIVDFRDPEHPLLALRDIERKSGEPIEDVIIKLLPSAFKSRWFMECPLSGQRCDLLYWRDDVFGSARAVRYVHRSQRRWKKSGARNGTREQPPSRPASG